MVSKQVAAPPTPPAITGEVGKEKTLSWITGITVAQITELHQQYNASFNDVLVAVLSGGLGNYLRSRGDDTTDVPVMLAVALKPMDLDSPEEAGNFAAMVSLTLPVGIEDPRERVAEVAHRMNRMKNSDEALLVIGLMNAVAATPDIVRAGLTKQVANTHSAVVTNVPGPAQPMNLAGVEVAGLVGHNPARAKQPMTGRCSATTATSRSAS
jgi:diacylglycerol O-acyltransferase